MSDTEHESVTIDVQYSGHCGTCGKTVRTQIERPTPVSNAPICIWVRCSRCDELAVGNRTVEE